LIPGHQASVAGEGALRLTGQPAHKVIDLVRRWSPILEEEPVPAGWSALCREVWENIRGLPAAVREFARTGVDLLAHLHPQYGGGRDLQTLDFRTPFGMYHTAVHPDADVTWRLAHSFQREGPLYVHALTPDEALINDNTVALLPGPKVSVRGGGLSADGRPCVMVVLQDADLRNGYSASEAELFVVSRAQGQTSGMSIFDLARGRCFAEAWTTAAATLDEDKQFYAFLLTTLLHMEDALLSTTLPKEMRIRRAILDDLRQLTTHRLAPVKVELLERISGRGLS
jgi:hypothetical protein